MANINRTLRGCATDLSCKVIRSDGRAEFRHLSSGFIQWAEVRKRLMAPLSWWQRLWLRLRREAVIPASIGFTAFLAQYVLGSFNHGAELALVTSVGVNLMAQDFVPGAGTHISAFNYHDCGVGTAAENVNDTGLVTPYGGGRVAGTQSNPGAGQYRSVATINFTSSKAIQEWGLFSAASGGVLWDRRVFGAINVQNGDSIQFTYTLTINPGGS